MRTIDKQITDLIDGRMTAEQIAAEGVGDYAIRFYQADSEAGWNALTAIRAAVAAVAVAVAPVQHTAPVMHLCKCGHESANPMNTASGTACARCYDRMSE